MDKIEKNTLYICKDLVNPYSAICLRLCDKWQIDGSLPFNGALFIEFLLRHHANLFEERGYL